MLVSFMRYIRGYLRIRVSGYSPERFLNLCKNKKIDVWDLKASSDSYLMYIKISGFRKLKPIVKKTKTKVTIEERIGLPFFFYKYRKRLTFWCGSIFSILLILLLTFFIWNIECVGNQHITDEVILEFLQTKQIFPGTLKTQISCEQLAKDIRKNFDDVIWVSCSMKGTKLMVHIKENTDTFSQNEFISNACDLISTQNGIVTNIVTRNGVPKVQVGSEVKKGDVLVSGTVEIYNDAKEVVATHLVLADASVSIKSIREYKETISRKYQKKKYTNRTKTLPYLRIGNHAISLGFSKNSYKRFDIFTKESRLKLGDNITLPISFGKKVFSEYEWVEKEYTEDQMEMLLNKNFELYCNKLEQKEIKIIEKDLTITQTNKEGIAMSTLILIEENCFDRKSIDF